MGIFATSVDDPQYASNMGLFRGIASGDVAGSIEAAQEGLLNRKIKQVDLSSKQLAEKRAQATFEMMQEAIKRRLAMGQGAPSQPETAPTPGGLLGSGTFGVPTGGQAASAPQGGPSGPGGNVANELQQLDLESLMNLPGVQERLATLKYRNEMQPVQAGGYTRNPVTGAMTYNPDPTKGVTMGPGNSVQMMPNADAVQARLAGATAGAQEAAKDQFAAPTTINLPGGPRLMSPAAARALASNGGGATAAPASPAASGYSNLAPQAGVTGRFVGDPADVIEGISKIKDPQEQANALAAFAQQMRASGGKLPPAQSAPGVALQSEPEKASLMKTAEATAADVAEQRKTIMNSGFNAPSNISKYKQLGSLLEGVDGGRLTQTGTNIASTMNSLGLKIDKNLPNKEAAAALGNQMALELRSPAGGAGMPGALSDKDREFLVGMVPNAGQTAQGRKMLIDSYVAMQQRNQQIATFARNYEKKYGRLDNGFFDQMQAWSNANPLFGGK